MDKQLGVLHAYNIAEVGTEKSGIFIHEHGANGERDELDGGMYDIAGREHILMGDERRVDLEVHQLHMATGLVLVVLKDAEVLKLVFVTKLVDKGLSRTILQEFYPHASKKELSNILLSGCWFLGHLQDN